VVGPLLTLGIPWQQNVMGIGYVSAYAPLERRQLVESPVSGRIKRWHVQEGAKVRADDLLVDITDIDQNYATRLAEQRVASAGKLAAKEQELRSYRLQVSNLEATRELQIATARQRLDVASQVTERMESVIVPETSLKLRQRQLKLLMNDSQLKMDSTTLLVPT
jgi:multidrug efflux pump subunit AcrA (membrane-fusion protein)